MTDYRVLDDRIPHKLQLSLTTLFVLVVVIATSLNYARSIPESEDLRDRIVGDWSYQGSGGYDENLAFGHDGSFTRIVRYPNSGMVLAGTYHVSKNRFVSFAVSRVLPRPASNEKQIDCEAVIQEFGGHLSLFLIELTDPIDAEYVPLKNEFGIPSRVYWKLRNPNFDYEQIDSEINQ